MAPVDYTQSHTGDRRYRRGSHAQAPLLICGRWEQPIITSSPQNIMHNVLGRYSRGCSQGGGTALGSLYESPHRPLGFELPPPPPLLRYEQPSPLLTVGYEQPSLW